jgi:hypothetical protein
VVTFTNAQSSVFALNWAQQLQAVGLPSLIGMSERLGAETEGAAEAAGSRLFCAGKSGLMATNGQAGRWAEVIPVLQLARQLSLSVLLSDADIAWIRNPLPYFAAARAAHPRLDVLMMTDRAFNGYSSERLSVQPDNDGGSGHSSRSSLPRSGFWGGRRLSGAASAAGGGHSTRRGARSTSADLELDPRSTSETIALELEPGFESSISYNIGVIWFAEHAMRELEAMLGRWVVAVGGGAANGGGNGNGGGDAGASGKRTKLASWDQEPINKAVLQVGLRPDPKDRRLVRVDSGRLAMGVLPMLQFTTSFTYHMFSRRREALGARPYCLHAIFAHGKEMDRKRAILRE